MRLEPFKIERYFAPYEFTARYMLSGSDCESFSIQELLDLVPGAADGFSSHWLGYTETVGSPVLREAIAGLYEVVEADGILIHNGAGEGIVTFMNAMLGPGDHVIVHYPCYQSLFQVAEAIGCKVTRWVTSPDTGWGLDLNLLEDSITERTRAIIVNCPHNPTGYLMERETLDSVISLARAHDVLLFSDEVYHGLEYDPLHRLPAACDLYENAVSLGVLSKTYGLPGLRIGWIATQNKKLCDSLLIVKDYTTLCNAAPSEFLAHVAIQAHDRIHARNLEIVTSNLALLRQFFAEYDERLRWVEPKAGAICFPTVTGGDPNGFCRKVLERQDVLLLPGTVYDEASSQIRIGYGRRNMPEALSRLGAYLDDS